MSNLFGFPQGLSGGSKETEYLSTFNTSRSTDYTTNFNTSQNTNRGTSSGANRTTSYNSIFQTAQATQGDAPASQPYTEQYGDSWSFITAGGGTGFKFQVSGHNLGYYFTCSDHSGSHQSSAQAAAGNSVGVLWQTDETTYKNWFATIIPSSCWLSNRGFGGNNYFNYKTEITNQMTHEFGDTSTASRYRYACNHLAGYARSLEYIWQGFIQKFYEIAAQNAGSYFGDPAIEPSLQQQGVPPAFARGNYYTKRTDPNTTMIIADGNTVHGNLTWYYNNYGGDVGGYGDLRTASFQNSLPTRQHGSYHKFGTFRVVTFPNIDDVMSMQLGNNTQGANNIWSQSTGTFGFQGGCDRYNVANYGWYNTQLDTGQWVSKTTSWTTNYSTNWNSIWGTDKTTQRVTTYSTDILTSHITYG